MTATPYFDSYELKRSVKVNSLWVIKRNRETVRVILVNNYNSVKIRYENFDEKWVSIDDLLNYTTPLKKEFELGIEK